MNAPGNHFRDWNFSLQEETHEGIKKKRNGLTGEKFDSWKKNAPGTVLRTTFCLMEKKKQGKIKTRKVLSFRERNL